MTRTAMARMQKDILHIEEAVAILRAGQHAGFKAPEYAIAVTGYEAISPVAEKSGQQLEQQSGEAPEASEVLKDEEDGVRARQQMLVGLFIINDHVSGIEVLRISAVVREDGGGKGALQ